MAGARPGYIPYMPIAAYAKDHGYADVAELDLFVYLVQGMDTVYIEHVRKVEAAAAAKNTKK